MYLYLFLRAEGQLHFLGKGTLYENVLVLKLRYNYVVF